MADASVPVVTGPRFRPAAGLVLVWAASSAVLALCLRIAFRLGWAADAAAVAAINGPRVLMGAAVGAALAGAGALRQGAARTDAGAPRRGAVPGRGGGESPLFELRLLALGAGAAGGGFGLPNALPGLPAALAFAIGAAGGAAALVALVQLLDRPRRAANLGVAALLVAGVAIAAIAGSYARARTDLVAPAVAWLLGDLGGATLSSGGAVGALAALALVVGASALARGDRARALGGSWLAFGLGVGAAGPLAFVGSMVPRAVRALAPGAAPRPAVAASAAAGAATVAAIDAVPRWLVGGYDFPWNVPAALLAIPIFLGWNRARLRREAGRAHPLFEALELLLIAALTLTAAGFAAFLAHTVRTLT